MYHIWCISYIKNVCMITLCIHKYWHKHTSDMHPYTVLIYTYWYGVCVVCVCVNVGVCTARWPGKIFQSTVIHWRVACSAISPHIIWFPSAPPPLTHTGAPHRLAIEHAHKHTYVIRWWWWCQTPIPRILCECVMWSQHCWTNTNWCWWCSAHDNDDDAMTFEHSPWAWVRRISVAVVLVMFAVSS